MLNATDRMQMILAAPPQVLARIDAVLTGEDTASTTHHQTECRIVTFADAARHLACSRPVIYGLVKSGRLETIMLNGCQRITMRSIIELADGERPADKKTIERINRNRITRATNARGHKGKRGVR